MDRSRFLDSRSSRRSTWRRSSVRAHPPGRKDKVTGAGRHRLHDPHGHLHAKFGLPTTPARASFRSAPAPLGRCPACSRGSRTRTSPTSIMAPLSRTVTGSPGAVDEGELVAAVARAYPRDRRAGRRHDRGGCQPLVAIVDIEHSLAEVTPLVHDDWESYGAEDALISQRQRRVHSSITKGDTTRPWPPPDKMIKGRYVSDMSHAVPIEQTIC